MNQNLSIKSPDRNYQGRNHTLSIREPQLCKIGFDLFGVVTSNADDAFINPRVFDKLPVLREQRFSGFVQNGHTGAFQAGNRKLDGHIAHPKQKWMDGQGLPLQSVQNLTYSGSTDPKVSGDVSTVFGKSRV